MSFTKDVGKFFGIASTDDSDYAQELQNKVEKQIKNGDFGISLKRSFTTTPKTNSAKLLSNARRVMTLVRAVQQEEESAQQDDEVKQESKSKSGEDETMPTFSSKEAKPSLMVAVNQLYYTEDELDVSSGSTVIITQANHDSRNSSGLLQEFLHVKVSHEDTRPVTEYESDKPQELVSETDVDNVDIDDTVSDVKNEPENLTKELDCGKAIIESKTDKEEIIDTDTTKEEKEAELVSTIVDHEEDEETADNKNKPGGGEAESVNGDIPMDTLEKKPVSVMKADRKLLYIAKWISHLSENDVKVKSSQLGPEDFVYGKDAFIHYKLYTLMEKRMEKRELMTKLKEKMAEYNWKIQAVDELVTLAKDYYMNPKSKKAKRWRALKHRVKKSSSHKLGGSENRRKLDSITEYKPFFTIFIILAQLIAMTVMIVLGQLTYIGVQPQLSLEEGVQTFFGMETVHKWTPPNIWIGPDQQFIISVGGVYAPCMRHDINIQLLYTTQNLSTHEVLGCCEVKARNTAGTTTQAECASLTEGVGVWRAGVTCGQRSAVESSVRHVLKPCCVGRKGQCRLMSHKHCTFLEGHFYKDGHEHCSQVNCLETTCKPGTLAPALDQPWRPASPQQYWRVPLSLLYHQGVIHVLLVVVAQWLLLVQIERTAGWLRMIIIYTLSGTGALLISAIMDPYQCHVGAVGAVFGMVGVTLIELVQFWNIIQSPVKELLKLLAAIAVFLLCGTLPYLNIFGMLGGLVIGALTGILLLPYITFSRWRKNVRLVLIMLSVPLLLLIFILLNHVFRVVQTTDSCSFCKLLNCVPYTDKMCDTNLWQQ